MSSPATPITATLVGANPGPAAHIALLGIVIVAALVIFGIVRRRNKREAAEAEMHSTTHDHTLAPPHTPAAQDRTRSGPREDA